MGYTDPSKREAIKNRIMAGSKGGKPGQWSARKAQLLAQAYEKAGGGYTGDLSDIVMLEKTGKVLGLKAKGPAKKDRSGFVIDPV